MISTKLCGLVFVICCVYVRAQSENPGVRAVIRVYEECSKADGFSPCLKKKAITFMDRLARMEKLSVIDGITVVRSGEITNPVLSEEQLENNLPRSQEAKEAALDKMLMEKATTYLSSRTLQITLPQIDAQELGRAMSEGIATYPSFVTNLY